MTSFQPDAHINRKIITELDLLKSKTKFKINPKFIKPQRIRYHFYQYQMINKSSKLPKIDKKMNNTGLKLSLSVIG